MAQQKVKKPFYKRVWFWILVVIVLVIAVPAIVGGGSSDSSSSSKSSTAKTAKGSSTKKEAVTPAKAKTISFDNGDKKIVSEVTYPVKLTDTSWAGTTVSIDKARIIQVKPFKDDGDNKMYQGIILVHFNVKATRDIDFYPSQGTIVTSDGQQSDADSYDSDQFDGSISKGVSKDGTVAFEIPRMTNPKAIKTLRLKWDADYDTDNMDDSNSNKTYDVTITLN